MKNKVGVMQGRLLPKYQGLYQAHPAGYWQDEFEISQKIGLNCIEFILDFDDAEKNPLLKKGGVNEILAVSKKSGISINTICADYFMEAPLHSINESVAEHSLEILKRLIRTSYKIGVTDIVIPCVDQSTLSSPDDVDRFVSKVSEVLPEAEQKGINLSLETDLAPQPFVDLLEKFDSDRITVNYDIGNSAALGYNLQEELDAYGYRISDIHIKDRICGGGSVILGQGDADFKMFFSKLEKYDYNGPFIMQAYRDDEGVAIFKKQFSWIQPYLKKNGFLL